ncbi:hypothetical protein OG453_44380 [Streptomyces sp. NBC_01381]|uniref:DUF6414 family protein n=1 Tax=Streptomyces sp. NBC_01381 TaxID=2903845 RepID=UPI00224F21D2|nr:hypothetical protein [Streptomyces sp. NBC_01381]MCX4673596.1 hypothetical protein [Streptomyces sp. NBC_01381]
MALRSPSFLDLETLLSQAEYHDINVPKPEDIVETTLRKRSGGGKLGVGALALNGSAGSDVQYQSTYSLEPREKATVSRVIDDLVSQDAVLVNPVGDSALSRDVLIEIEGTARITAVSVLSKVFFLFRRLMIARDIDALNELANLDMEDAAVAEEIRRVYLENELLPLPVLLELTESSLPHKVYVNVRPDFFIDEASADRIEGDLRVLGSVSKLIPAGQFRVTDEWLLYGWEFLMRRIMMAQLQDDLEEVTAQLQRLGLNLPDDDVHAYISGPAVIIDAIALY